MFYKVEEKGESIHAELNAIQRRIWCIRDPAECLWKYVESYELKNVLNTDIVVPEKRSFKNKGQWNVCTDTSSPNRWGDGDGCKH